MAEAIKDHMLTRDGWENVKTVTTVGVGHTVRTKNHSYTVAPGAQLRYCVIRTDTGADQAPIEATDVIVARIGNVERLIAVIAIPTAQGTAYTYPRITSRIVNTIQSRELVAA